MIQGRTLFLTFSLPVFQASDFVDLLGTLDYHLRYNLGRGNQAISVNLLLTNLIIINKYEMLRVTSIAPVHFLAHS